MFQIAPLYHRPYNTCSAKLLQSHRSCTRSSCCLVASMAVSNFDCLLVESLQWDEYKTQVLPQTPTPFVCNHKFICTSRRYSFVRIQCHMHLQSTSGFDRHISEDKASFVQIVPWIPSPSVVPIQDSHNVVPCSRHSFNSKRLVVQ